VHLAGNETFGLSYLHNTRCLDLDRVQGGESIVITRHGQPVAKMVPVSEPDGESLRAALNTFGEVRGALLARRVKPSRAQVRRWINEGRR